MRAQNPERISELINELIKKLYNSDTKFCTKTRSDVEIVFNSRHFIASVGKKSSFSRNAAYPSPRSNPGSTTLKFNIHVYPTH